MTHYGTDKPFLSEGSRLDAVTFLGRLLGAYDVKVRGVRKDSPARLTMVHEDGPEGFVVESWTADLTGGMILTSARDQKDWE